MLRDLRTEDNGQPYGTILSAEKERADGRRLRIVQARPAVPEPVPVTLVGTSALAVFGIAAFTLPYVSRRTQAGALIVLTGVLATVQIAIIDMDRKYDGLIRVEPQDFVIAEQALTDRCNQRYGDATVPCDDQGLPA